MQYCVELYNFEIHALNKLIQPKLKIYVHYFISDS